MKQLKFFAGLFYRFSIRHMKKHRKRAIAVLIGIALGAAVFSSVRLSVRASLDAFGRSMDRLTGMADQMIVKPGARIDDKLVATLLQHPAIESASPVLSVYVQPVISNREMEPFLLIGFDPILDGPIRQWRSTDEDQDRSGWIDLMVEPFTLIAGQRLLSDLKKNPGEQIRLSHMSRSADFKILDVMTGQGLALAEEGRIAIADIATFQEFTGLHGKADRIDLLLKPGTSKADENSIRNALPEGVQMGPASENKETGVKMIHAYQINLSLLSFVSLFVGMFLVYSLVALNVASRKRELAILRSVGAPSKTLFMLFLTEGLLFGVVGWLIAIPLGGILTRYMLHGVSRTISTLFVRVQVDGLSLSAWELILSFCVTVGVAALGALLPARTAMLAPPKQVLASSEEKKQTRSPLKLAVPGLCLIVLIVPLCLMPGIQGIPLPGYIAVLLLFIGFSLISPWWLRNTGEVFLPISRKIGAEPAYLAAHYIRGTGVRTAVSVGALITAVALFVSLAIMVNSFRQTVKLWVEQTVSGDVFLRPKISEMNRHRFYIPDETVKALKTLNHPVDLVADRRMYLSYNTLNFELNALDLKTFFRHGDFMYLEGNIETIRRNLMQGKGVLITEVFANRTGLGIGDAFRIQAGGAKIDKPVLGIVRDYSTHGGTVFYSLQDFQKNVKSTGGISGMEWTGVRLFFKTKAQASEKSLAELRESLLSCCGENLEIVYGKKLRRTVLKIFDETFAVTFVLLLIALCVAAIGIATTLTVSVLERARQLNTLYAVGADRGQINAMILWEAFLLVVAGEAAGIICGFILSFILVYVINRQSFGWTFIYSVDWKSISISLPLIVLTALAAAFPAIRAVFREPPATILREK
jgi:putative ABC transport system permease protein